MAEASIQTRIAELQRDLSVRFRLAARTVQAGARTWTVYLAADMDELLDALIAKGTDHPDVRDERLPYWADIWPSALALAARVAREGWIRPDQCVLELGCGPGVAGLCAAEAARVVVSDLQPDALQLATLNWLVNVGRAPETLLLDWRDPQPAWAADVLLASDVAYEARFFMPLIRTFQTMLRPGGYAILGEPGRPVARPFFEQLAAAGFAVTGYPEPAGPTGGVTVYRIERGA